MGSDLKQKVHQSTHKNKVNLSLFPPEAAQLDFYQAKIRDNTRLN